MKVVLGLTYDTTPEQIEQALQILTDIVSEAGAQRMSTRFGSVALGTSAST